MLIYGLTVMRVYDPIAGADLVAVINLGYSLADRDANNKTPRDIAEEQELTENVEAIGRLHIGLSHILHWKCFVKTRLNVQVTWGEEAGEGSDDEWMPWPVLVKMNPMYVIIVCKLLCTAET